MATGHQITGQTVAMNFAFNTFTNGAGSVSSKKATKADVPPNKPKAGDVPVTKSRQSSTPVQQLALPGPNPNVLRIEAPKTNVSPGIHSTMSKTLKGTDLQAHHVNQAAMMKKTVSNYSYKDGITVPLRGNVRTDIGSPHYNAHASLEDFYNQYRKGGSKYGDIPTISDYNHATAKSLKEASLTDSQVGEVMSVVKAEQLYYGLTDNSEIVLPGRMPLPKKK